MSSLKLYLTIFFEFCIVQELWFFKDAGTAPGPAPGPQLEVQVSTWTSTPIAEMVWYDFVCLFRGYKKGKTSFL